MTQKMVARFRRTLSFPNPPSPSSSTKPTVVPKKNFHLRSTSLPCRSHPLISQLKHPITDLKSFIRVDQKPDEDTTNFLGLDQLCDGLSRLRTVHESLNDLLHLPPSRDSLRGHPDLVEKVLEDFLRLVDVYGIFRTLILALKQDQLAAQLAIRRRDDSKAGLCMKNLKKTANEMSKLVSAVQPIGQYPLSYGPGCDPDLVGVISDVIEVTVSVSGALFEGISGSFLTRKSSWVKRMWGLRRKREEEVKMVVMKKMREMEECIDGIECGSERVFRSLINTRVSLLNVYTQ